MTDDLYREVILDHYRHPRNLGKLPAPDVCVNGVNPLCGDAIELTFLVRDGRIDDIKTAGNGCSISQSSASMMTEALKGKSLGDSAGLAAAFKKMMLENAPADQLPEDLEELSSLEGVRKYPVRIKCALLAWNTLLEGIKEYERRLKREDDHDCDRRAGARRPENHLRSGNPFEHRGSGVDLRS